MILIYLIANTISIGLPLITPLVPQYNVDAQIDDSTFELKPHTSFGNCSCDISKECTPYCCCDPDCSGVSFPYCIDSENTPFELTMCSDKEKEGGGKVIEWFLRTSLCIQRNNNPSPGDFYDLDLDISQESPTESYPSSLRNIFTGDDSNSYPNSRQALSVFQKLRVDIPRRSSNGQCVNKSMLYLESIDETCSSGNGTEVTIELKNLSTCNGNESCIVNMVQNTVTSYDNVRIIVKWGSRPQSMSPTGYHFGEPILDINGNPIYLGDKCETDDWKNFELVFGKQTDILCKIQGTEDEIFQKGYDEQQRQNITYLNFTNTTILFPYTNYSISPYVNNIPDNNGTIREEIPDIVIVREGKHLMITQSLSIIYKSIGPKENPQRIISDFKINYFTSDAPNTTLIRMVARFYEQPNELTIFDDPSMADIYQWLPF